MNIETAIALADEDAKQWGPEPDYDTMKQRSAQVGTALPEQPGDPDPGYTFLLADGEHLNADDFLWCEGLLKLGDVTEELSGLADSLRDTTCTSEIVECQILFIMLAINVNGYFNPHAKPSRIKAILKTWKHFHEFLCAQDVDSLPEFVARPGEDQESAHP